MNSDSVLNDILQSCKSISTSAVWTGAVRATAAARLMLMELIYTEQPQH